MLSTSLILLTFSRKFRKSHICCGSWLNRWIACMKLRQKSRCPFLNSSRRWTSRRSSNSRESNRCSLRLMQTFRVVSDYKKFYTRQRTELSIKCWSPSKFDRNSFLCSWRLGMTRKRGLYLSFAIHRAVFDLNEEGTEAAAAPAMGMVLGSPVILKPPRRLICDHPVQLLDSVQFCTYIFFEELTRACEQIVLFRAIIAHVWLIFLFKIHSAKSLSVSSVGLISTTTNELKNCTP